MKIIDKIENKSAVIGIVGLGYVGLPLMLAYTAKGYQTIGFDIDQGKVDDLMAGRSYIDHISSDDIANAVQRQLFEATVDFKKISDVDTIILCVPTPLDKHFEPDLSYVTGTMDMISPHLRDGQLVSLESTTYPGTTEEELRPRIEAQGFEVGKDVYLVYSPEREDPGNANFSSKNIPKVVGGSTTECAKVGEALYKSAISEVVMVDSTQVAEFTKLLENIYRAVNIGLVNELKVAADSMGIDIWEVINAAATKPFGFKAFYPGPGLGGHCIPIDPFYLTWKAREYGVHTRFIELAGEINRSMPDYVINRVIEALNDEEKSVKGSKILILGLAYKANVDDMRESPSFDLMDLLDQKGAIVDYYDPYVLEIGPTREHGNWQGKKSIVWDEKNVEEYDLVLIATNHDVYNAQQIADWSNLIVDTRNLIATSGCEIGKTKVWKA